MSKFKSLIDTIKQDIYPLEEGCKPGKKHMKEEMCDKCECDPCECEESVSEAKMYAIGYHFLHGLKNQNMKKSKDFKTKKEAETAASNIVKAKGGRAEIYANMFDPAGRPGHQDYPKLLKTIKEETDLDEAADTSMVKPGTKVVYGVKVGGKIKQKKAKVTDVKGEKIYLDSSAILHKSDQTLDRHIQMHHDFYIEDVEQISESLPVTKEDPLVVIWEKPTSPEYSAQGLMGHMNLSVANSIHRFGTNGVADKLAKAGTGKRIKVGKYYLEYSEHNKTQMVKESKDEYEDDDDKKGKKKKGEKDQIDMKPSMADQRMTAEGKGEEKPPFDGSHPIKQHKDKYGNVIKTKNLPKHLAKSAMRKVMNKEETLDELSSKLAKESIGKSLKASIIEARRGRPPKNKDAEGGLEHIQMQLRKSVSLRGAKNVEFGDGKKVKVHPDHAQKVLSKIDAIKAPKDRQNAVNHIAKSHKNMMDFHDGKAVEMDPVKRRQDALKIK